MTFSQAAPRTWIGGNVDWLDGGAAANWTPNDEPDADDEAIFNTANAVNLGSNNSIMLLTMSGGIDLFTNGFDLSVDGEVEVAGGSTILFIGDAASELNADTVTIGANATVELRGGTLVLDEEAGTSLLAVGPGGNLWGNGVITFADTPVAATTLLTNDGQLTALSRGPLFSPPPLGSLQINDSSLGGRVDLDGIGVDEDGVVNVNRNQTLDLNVPFSDVFNGTLNLGHNATFDSLSPWTLAMDGVINADNGFFDGVFPVPDIPADKSIIAGGHLTQTLGSTINVVDTDGTLQFDAIFTMNGGTFVNEGHTIFNANATINNTATFTMGTSGSDLTVGDNADVTITQPSFNLDGSAPTTVITVNPGGTLTLDLGDYDNDAAPNVFDAVINLNRGVIDLTTSDAEFVMDGTLNMDGTSGNFAGWLGEPVDIGNDAGVLDADLNVTGSSSGDAQFNAQVDFNSDADVNVAAGGTLVFLTDSTVNFHTVNGGSNAEFTGAGIIEFNGAVNVVEAVTLNMTGGTVDLDGSDSVGETINVDAPLTINAATMDSFGRVNGVGTNLLDINNSAGTGVLTVTLDDPNGEWTLNGPGVLNLVNDSTAATLLAGNDLNINGTVNVAGDVRTTARLDIAGVVNINTPNEPLRLAGGDNINDPNTIVGGTISGGGLLGADDGKLLQGFGTINAGIDFDGSATFRADNGTLTINGPIVDVGTVGTVDADGTLHVTNAWNNNVSSGVQLRGGTLSGGTITNDATAGISGHGLVTARVINNSQLFASIGDTLLFQTAGNDNDWDGTTNDGEIEATQADIEIRDVGLAFPFTGTVRATNGNTAFANGFALDFNPGSTLSLASGGTYRAASSTDIGGTVSVGVTECTVEVENNFFLTFEAGSSATLAANLRVKNNNIIVEAGATFSGAGALIIPNGSHMVGENLADIGVLLQMNGGFRPGNSEGIGRVDLFGYQQGSTGQLFVELTGTALNAFDRLVVDGTAQLAGPLEIDLDVPYVPAPGHTFDIITAMGGVSGKFVGFTTKERPDGVAFDITYGATFVRLTVVAGSNYDVWISKFPLNPADSLKTANPDFDGMNNLAEFGFDGNPTTSWGANEKFAVKRAPVGGVQHLTITVPMRFATVKFPPAQDPGELTLLATEDDIRYRVQGTDSLDAYSLPIVEVIGPDAAAIQLGLPALNAGWEYRTFRTTAPFNSSVRQLLRVQVEDAP